METSFDIGPEVSTIDLAREESSIEPGKLLTVTGWGATTEGGFGSNSLKKVVVPTILEEECNASTSYAGAVKPGMFCAGIGGKDSCQGDSGGPIVSGRVTSEMVQLGVVSWGYGCARPNYPGVYADVSAYIDWIEGELER